MIVGVGGLSQRTKQVMSSSLTKQTTQQYSRYIHKFQAFCRLKDTTLEDATVTTGIEFLSHLFHDANLKYPGLNQARSALSLVLNTHSHITFGNTENVKRFMLGFFKLKPIFPRYTTTFDASIVLEHIRLIHNDTATLKDLSMKLTVLFSLLTGKRDQSLVLNRYPMTRSSVLLL